MLSPLVSVYGCSPTATIAYEKPPLLTNSASGLSANTTSVDGSTAAFTASRTVVPTVVRPVSPCHSIVHPPHWYPRLSAWLPATRILAAFLGRGSSGASPGLPFLRSTSDLRTASRARSLCSCFPSWSARLGSGMGFSNRPMVNLTRRIRVTASSILLIGIRPLLT
uniref:Uncharacterized protein n=1 Tax=Zea mays TaxID=4577 RepID=C4J0N1_MAIZE|nr:unknown [Zea mays]ACR35920.1 unknown [Zea mays]ACR36917.1 unknown [Zea mays]